MSRPIAGAWDGLMAERSIPDRVGSLRGLMGAGVLGVVVYTAAGDWCARGVVGRGTGIDKFDVQIGKMR